MDAAGLIKVLYNGYRILRHLIYIRIGREKAFAEGPKPVNLLRTLLHINGETMFFAGICNICV